MKNRPKILTERLAVPMSKEQIKQLTKEAKALKKPRAVLARERILNPMVEVKHTFGMYAKDPE